MVNNLRWKDLVDRRSTYLIAFYNIVNQEVNVRSGGMFIYTSIGTNQERSGTQYSYAYMI